MTTPVFLVGARRSGTTLFRLMLDGHPQVLFQHHWEAVATAIRALDAPGAGTVTVEIDEIGALDADSPAALRDRIETALDTLLAKRGKAVLGATCHVDFLALQALWPNARFIHLLRDPRDVAISYLKLGWAGHAYFASDGWGRAEADWDELVRQLDPDQHIDLRYEDLVLDPEAELGRVCDFLGIPYSDSLFDYTRTSPYSYPKKDLVNRWKDQLSPRELLCVEARIRPVMAARGYAPQSDPAGFGAARIWLFGLQNTWRRRWRRIREGGFYFVVINILARRLKIPALARRAAELQAQKHAQHVRGLEKRY